MVGLDEETALSDSSTISGTPEEESGSSNRLKRERVSVVDHDQFFEVPVDQPNTPGQIPITPPSANPPSNPPSGVPPQLTFKIPKDPYWVKGELKNHGLYQDDTAALDRYPLFKNYVMKILDSHRHSGVDPTEFDQFTKANAIYGGANEDTFLNELLPYLCKDKHQVLRMDNDGVVDLFSESFFDSGLIRSTNREFLENSIQLPDDLKQALEKVPGMSNPKPDRTFGTYPNKSHLLDDTDLSPCIGYNLGIMPHMHFPFFLIESSQGSPAEAQNQACRAGGALVNATRSLLSDILHQADAPGPDYQSFVLSATLSPGLMDIWCHWAEVPSPTTEDRRKPKIHMSLLTSKALRDIDHFGKLRKYLHNILDWGLGERFHGKVERWYSLIMDYERKKEQEAVKDKDENPPAKRQKGKN
ncbi:MAG: hypothetical protein Q9172_006972 [Xanthocarpia lactea]